MRLARWLIDAELRYAASELNQKTRAAVQRDVDVPNISLESADAPLPPSGKRGPDGQGGDDGAYPAAAGSEITYHVHETDGEFRNDGESLPEDLTQDAAVIGQVGEPSRERNRTSEEFDTQSANGDGIMSEALPEFDEASGKPVSRKVSPGFHSHSRHTVQVCPKCSDPSLYRSRSRGAAEFLRKKFTNRRPYRCHRCGWRGWLSKGF